MFGGLGVWRMAEEDVRAAEVEDEEESMEGLTAVEEP